MEIAQNFFPALDIVNCFRYISIGIVGAFVSFFVLRMANCGHLRGCVSWINFVPSNVILHNEWAIDLFKFALCLLICFYLHHFQEFALQFSYIFSVNCWFLNKAIICFFEMRWTKCLFHRCNLFSLCMLYGWLEWCVIRSPLCICVYDDRITCVHDRLTAFVSTSSTRTVHPVRHQWRQLYSIVLPKNCNKTSIKYLSKRI